MSKYAIIKESYELTSAAGSRTFIDLDGHIGSQEISQLCDRYNSDPFDWEEEYDTLDEARKAFDGEFPSIYTSDGNYNIKLLHVEQYALVRNDYDADGNRDYTEYMERKIPEWNPE